MDTKIIDNAAMQAEMLKLQGMMTNLVSAVKLMRDEITALQDRCKELEALTQPQRIRIKKRVYRTLKGEPIRIITAGWLYHVCGIPSRTIWQAGVLTESKMFGLSHWDYPHLRAYAKAHGLADRLDRGFTEVEVRELCADNPKQDALIYRLHEAGTMEQLQAATRAYVRVHDAQDVSADDGASLRADTDTADTLED